MNFKLPNFLKPKGKGWPEPRFFDEMKFIEKVRSTISYYIRKKEFWGVVLVIGVFSFLYLFVYPKSTGKKVQPEKLQVPLNESKREEYSSVKIDREIDASVSKTEVQSVIAERQETLKAPQKRNLKTEIAVFCFKKEAERKRQDERPKETKERIGLPSGTKIPVLLENRIVSFNVAAPVLAHLPKDFLWKGKVAIPKDSKFLGEVSVLKSLDRINVSFDLLIFPDGRELRIHAMALSEDGAGGIKGKVEKHRDIKVLKAIGETLLSGATLFVGGRSADPYSLEDQLRLNAAQNLTNQAAQDIRSVRVDESVTVEAFVPVTVILLDSI